MVKSIPSPAWRNGVVRLATKISPTVKLFEVEADGPLDAIGPGAHCRFLIPVGSRHEARHYSLLPSTGSRLFRFAVKIHPHGRGGSKYMWRLAAGSKISFSGPHNHFPLRLGRPEYLLIAGGIGITPLVSMAEALSRSGATFRLLYSCQHRSDFLFEDELSKFGQPVKFHNTATGGFINFTEEFASLHGAAETYICGPPPMIRAAHSAWLSSGRSEESFRFENFGESETDSGERFVVEVQDRSISLAVPDNQSLLEALINAGVDMNYQCRRGECGLCVVNVISCSGKIDHRDYYLSGRQKSINEQMCTCVSRVSSGATLVIDTYYRP